ncbi:MAG: hypothetical protein WAL84_00620, partial [Candidatus Dormiibacterota bacterium]
MPSRPFALPGAALLCPSVNESAHLFAVSPSASIILLKYRAAQTPRVFALRLGRPLLPSRLVGPPVPSTLDERPSSNRWTGIGTA